jgi:hypothetical protein
MQYWQTQKLGPKEKLLNNKYNMEWGIWWNVGMWYVICGMWNVVRDMLVCGYVICDMWYVGMWYVVCSYVGMWYVGMWVCDMWYVGMWVCDMWYVGMLMLICWYGDRYWKCFCQFFGKSFKWTKKSTIRKEYWNFKGVALQYVVKTYLHTKIVNYIQNKKYLDESKMPKKFEHKKNLQQLF